MNTKTGQGHGRINWSMPCFIPVLCVECLNCTYVAYLYLCYAYVVVALRASRKSLQPSSGVDRPDAVLRLTIRPNPCLDYLGCQMNAFGCGFPLTNRGIL